MTRATKNARPEPSGDQRTWLAPAGTPVTSSGASPADLTRRSLVVLRFAAASCVVSVKITVAPSGDTWISPMSRTANTSSIVRGRGDRLWFRAFPAAPATMAVATTPMHAIAGTSHHARFFCLSCLPSQG